MEIISSTAWNGINMKNDGALAESPETPNRRESFPLARKITVSTKV